MLTIVQVQTDEHRQHVRDLFREYLVAASAMVAQEYGVTFDIDAMIARDMLELDKFAPPDGRLLLAQSDDRVAGIICLQKIGADTGEIKRLYVRPALRGRGIGRALIERLKQEARLAGYARLRLDSAHFMTAAHAVYRSAGFTEIAPYPESEIPPEFQKHWLFMELML